MLALVNNKSFSSEKVSSVRICILSGAAITEAQVIMLQKKFPNTNFATSYGLSEMAPVTITEYGDTVEHITQTVGKPVKNIEITIANKQNAGTSEKNVGEIMLKGYNLMTC